MTNLNFKLYHIYIYIYIYIYIDYVWYVRSRGTDLWYWMSVFALSFPGLWYAQIVYNLHESLQMSHEPYIVLNIVYI